MRRALVVLALLAVALGASCIDFDEAEKEYCATHTLCSDGGMRADAGP